MTYVENVFRQLRRRGIAKIVLQATEYYEMYGDYYDEADMVITYSMTDDGWEYTERYVGKEQELIPTKMKDFDDVLDSIVDDLYSYNRDVNSIKTFTDGDTIGIDVDF